jgi:hypothetical protein
LNPRDAGGAPKTESDYTFLGLAPRAKSLTEKILTEQIQSAVSSSGASLLGATGGFGLLARFG